jgi:hypothetical protein
MLSKGTSKMPPSKAKRAGNVSKKQVAAPRKKVVGKRAPAKKAPAKKARVAKKTPAASKRVAAKKASLKQASTAKKVAPKLVALSKQPGSAQRATPARDARQALTQKRAIAAALSPAADGKVVVDAYMRDVDHPFKAEMQAVREIILGASPKISERIKWNAPSFYYEEDLGAFNPRATEYAHLILLFPGGQGMDDSSGLLEGNHKERREAKFHSLDDVKAKKRALEKLVKGWVALRG